MKTKLVFATETKNTEWWTYLPFVPRIQERFNILDILKKEEIDEIMNTAHHWSGIHGTIQSVEYRHDDNEFYTEVFIKCED